MTDWNEVFSYKDGVLLWRPRNRSAFKNDRLYNSWTNRFCGKAAGRVSPPKDGIESYIRVRYAGKQYFLHRIVWEMFNGKLTPTELIDHINGDGLDNRVENLRKVTPLESSTNRPMPISNKSGVLGVCFNKKHKRWQASIGKTRLGSFKNFEDAVNARKIAEKDSGYHANHGRPGRLREQFADQCGAISPARPHAPAVQDAAAGK